MSIKSTIKSGIDRWSSRQCHSSARLFYNNVVRNNPLSGLDHLVDGEQEWLQKWRKYDEKLSPLAYRVFSKYIGPDLNICPLEVCTLLETVLTPSHFSSFYSDKNSLDLIFPSGTLPETYLRNVGGKFLDKNYFSVLHPKVDEHIKSIEAEKIVLKPTMESSGRGVCIFYRGDDGFENKRGEKLSADFLLKNYKEDFLIQKAFSQHPFFAQFNSSSVNTIRIATWRNGEGIVQPLNSIIRIGSRGAEVDNAHAGGQFVGVSSNGELGKYVCNQYGVIQHTFNDVDFSNQSFVVPNWSEIVSFVCKLHSKVVHHDLVAWDVALDEDCCPHIIEVNVGGFSGWLFQFTSGPMFSRYTDELVETAYGRYLNTETKVYFTRKVK